jgi:hypothetical protein
MHRDTVDVACVEIFRESFGIKREGFVRMHNDRMGTRGGKEGENSDVAPDVNYRISIFNIKPRWRVNLIYPNFVKQKAEVYLRRTRQRNTVSQY